MFTLAIPSWWEMLLILAVVMILFGGAGKIPGLARALGSSVTEFKKGLKGGDGELPVPPKDGKKDGPA